MLIADSRKQMPFYETLGFDSDSELYKNTIDKFKDSKVFNKAFAAVDTEKTVSLIFRSYMNMVSLFEYTFTRNHLSSEELNNYSFGALQKRAEIAETSWGLLTNILSHRIIKEDPEMQLSQGEEQAYFENIVEFISYGKRKRIFYINEIKK